MLPSDLEKVICEASTAQLSCMHRLLVCCKALDSWRARTPLHGCRAPHGARRRPSWICQSARCAMPGIGCPQLHIRPTREALITLGGCSNGGQACLCTQAHLPIHSLQRSCVRGAMEGSVSPQATAVAASNFQNFHSTVSL